jgi:CheY-like chemotaxis protein
MQVRVLGFGAYLSQIDHSFREMVMTSSVENNVRNGVHYRFSNLRVPSVLVVDDSRDSANMLSSLFGAHGLEVHVAFDWTTALDTARAHLPDIILLDLGMPEMDGIHLALLFREDEQLKDKLIVAVTGYADDEHRQQCEAAGFDYLLPKPIAWADLKSTIDRLWLKRKKR